MSNEVVSWCSVISSKSLQQSNLLPLLDNFLEVIVPRVEIDKNLHDIVNFSDHMFIKKDKFPVSVMNVVYHDETLYRLCTTDALSQIESAMES